MDIVKVKVEKSKNILTYVKRQNCQEDKLLDELMDEIEKM